MKRLRVLSVFVLLTVLVSLRPAWAAEAPAAAPDASAELIAMADEVAKEVEALRGWKFKQPVKKQFCTPEDVRAYLQKELEEQVPAGKVERVQASLRMIGLLPPETELRKTLFDLLEEQVGGYYDSDTKALSLVKRPVKTPALVSRIMLAHELTHALDDQYVDLKAFVKSAGGKSEDTDLVVGSVMEGSATSLMSQYMIQAQLSGRFDTAELQQYALEEANRSQKFASAPRYFHTILAAYMCGMQFLARGNLLAMMLNPDNRAVGENFLAATRNPPRSTEQILHPEKYWVAETRDDPVVVDDPAATKLLAGPGRHVVHADTFGEMLCAILTTPKGKEPNLLAMAMAEAWTNPAAKGWGGDRFYLLAAGPNADAAGKALKDLRGVWLTVWDTPKDRDEFVEAWQSTRPAGASSGFGLGNLGAVTLFGFSETEAASIKERLERSPPPMTRAEKPWSPWSP